MKRIITATFAILACLTSCNFLDRDPLATISPENYFRSETDLQLFSNTFYDNLLDKEPYLELSDHYLKRNLTAVIRGGNARSVPISGGGWSWGNLRKMNTLLEYIDKCEDQNAAIQYAALTRFFRAYFYFEKVQRFGDVPWVEIQLNNTDGDILYAPRDSRETVMRHMIEDIDYAIGNLSADVSTYRVNRWTALALKARFCLYEGTFRKYQNPLQYPSMYIEPLPADSHDADYYLQQAVDAAREIINDGPYKLASDYLMLFANEDADTGEYILAIRNDTNLSIFNNSTGYVTMASQGAPGLTKKFVDSFLMADGSRFTDKQGWKTLPFVEEMTGRDPRLGFIAVTPGYKRIGSKEVTSPDFGCTVTGYQIAKYVQDINLYQIEHVNHGTNDMPVFRLGEVYLNYAEALAELGSLTQADLDISVNRLRDRVGMPHLDMTAANSDPDWYLSSAEYGYPNVDGPNKGVILEIRRERAVELAQEGFRLADLARWRAGNCLNQEFYGVYFPGPGEYDLSGDGKADICLYVGTNPKHKNMADIQIGDATGVLLSDGTSGFMDYHQIVEHSFNEARDYYYPIPTKERELNPKLKQNPGWLDGLDY